MSKLQDFLRIAKEQIGTTEDPKGSNNIKYNTAYYGKPVSGGSYSWCAVFVWWCMREAGAADLYYDGKKSAYVPALLSWARQNGLVVSDPKPGDWVLFDWNANAAPDHIGIVEEVKADSIVTIEGNTDDAVRRVVRARDNTIQAFVRPAWPNESNATDEDHEIAEAVRRIFAIMGIGGG